MEAWKPRARAAWPQLAAANGVLSMGVLTGLAAPLIPWSSENGDFTGVTMPGALYYSSYSSFYYTGRVTNVYLLGGSITIFLGLLLCMIGWGLGLFAAARVRSVAVHGASAGGGCCAPSIPAILGLVWTGFTCCLSGAIANWTLTGLLLLDGNSFILGRNASSPGAGLLAFSIVCLFISAVQFSVTGCCGKCLPLLPRSRGNGARPYAPAPYTPTPTTPFTHLQRWGRYPAWARRAPTAAAWSATAPSRRLAAAARLRGAAAALPPPCPRSRSGNTFSAAARWGRRRATSKKTQQELITRSRAEARVARPRGWVGGVTLRCT